MKMFFAILSVLLSSSKLFAHQYEEVVDGVTWYYNVSDGQAEITCRSNDGALLRESYSGTLAIPSSLGGRPVTSIGSYAFYACTGLLSVVIPSSITCIESNAFYGCSGLSMLMIPARVEKIDVGAFAWCSGLTTIAVSQDNSSFEAIDNCLLSKDGAVLVRGPAVGDVAIPSNVTRVAGHAFSGCSGLTSVWIPAGVTSIGDSAFYSCRSLVSVAIPSSVTNVGDHAFASCSGLKAVTIPSSVTCVDRYAFYWCTGLTSVMILSGSRASIGDRTFEGCQSLASITMPEGVTSIGAWAFRDCRALTSVTLPSSVTSIGDSAFRDCWALTSVKIPSRVKRLGGYLFYGCKELTSVVIPHGVTNIGENAFGWCSKMASVSIPSSVTSIGQAAFGCCGGLKTLYVDPGDMDRVHDLLENSRSWLDWEGIFFETLPGTLVESWVVEYLASNFRKNGESAEEYRARFRSLFGSDYVAALTKKTGKVAADGTRLTVWHDYIAGTDPTDSESVFKAEMTLVNGRPMVTWSPTLPAEGSGGRKYTVYGKRSLDDPDWIEVMDSSENMQFFKVAVDLLDQ